jgi:nucleoside-diphosphate-sugar epimerase
LQSVFLTGATGFIASHIAEQLLEQGITARLLVRRRTPLINGLEQRGAAIYLAPSSQDLKTLRHALQPADTIIHCAASTRALTEKDYLEANVQFTSDLLGQTTRGQRFVFISSQAAVGPSNSRSPVNEQSPPRPLSHYGKSKLAAEGLVRDWGGQNQRNYVILRPSMVYGPRERDLYQAFKLMKKGLFLQLGRGQLKLSLIHVTDLVCAVLTAAEHSAPGETYFVSNDNQYTWEEVGECIQAALNRARVLKLKLPVSIACPAAWLSDLWSFVTRKPALLGTQKLLEMKQKAWLCSNKKIKETLGWGPRLTLEEGIRMTTEWYAREGWI